MVRKPPGNGTSGANNTSGNGNSGCGDGGAIRHSGRGSNNGIFGSGNNGDSGSADHTHPHRAAMEANAELANNGQSKAPLGTPHMAHMAHAARLDGVADGTLATGSDESGGAPLVYSLHLLISLLS